jgi:hypothetical protein
MATITEWSADNDSTFARAVEYIKEDLANGDSLHWAISHYSELFGIDREALQHEWSLRSES